MQPVPVKPLGSPTLHVAEYRMETTQYNDPVKEEGEDRDTR